MAVNEIIRLIHPLHYSYELNRFKSEAVELSDDGLSVIDSKCCVATSGNICSHIDRFYPTNISGSPPIFLRFRVEEIPAGHSLAQCDSDSGDACHHLVNGLGKKFGKRLVERTPLDRYEICDAGSCRALTIEDIEVQNPRAS